MVVRVSDAVSTREELFDILETGLQFPYFGRNWDALIDLLSDLTWLSYDEVSILHDGKPAALGDVWQEYVEVLSLAISRRHDALARGFPDHPLLIIALPEA